MLAIYYWGCPWQFNRKVMHNGHLNTYNLMFNATKIVLLPNKEVETSYSSRKDIITLLSFAKFEWELHNALVMLALVATMSSNNDGVPAEVKPLIHNLLTYFLRRYKMGYHY